jgi:hypothetical protein
MLENQTRFEQFGVVASDRATRQALIVSTYISPRNE